MLFLEINSLFICEQISSIFGRISVSSTSLLGGIENGAVQHYRARRDFEALSGDAGVDKPLEEVVGFV